MPGEYWAKSNFLHELPEKWELSFCAWDNNIVAGYAILSRRSADTVHLHHFMAACRRRGKGLGAMMLEEAIRRARSTGAANMSLKVGDDNARAISFYHRAGFEQTDSANGYLTLVKRL